MCNTSPNKARKGCPLEATCCMFRIRVNYAVTSAVDRKDEEARGLQIHNL